MKQIRTWKSPQNDTTETEREIRGERERCTQRVTDGFSASCKPLGGNVEKLENNAKVKTLQELTEVTKSF